METISNDRSRQDLGRTNRRAVLAELVLNGPLSRTAIAERTGLTAASVSRITRDLIAARLVRESDAPTKTGRPGRRFVALELNPSGGYVLGIGLNVFQQSVTLADLRNHRIDRIDLKFHTLSDPDTVLADVVSASRRLIERHVPDRRRLIGGGVAITGAIDPISGTVKRSPYLGWSDVPVAESLQNALGIPIRVENLPNAVNQAEARFGQTRGERNVLLMNCALGNAASLYLDGKLVRGNEFLAGLVGGVPLIGAESQSVGEVHSTLDDLASGSAVLKRSGLGDLRLDEQPPHEIADRLMSLIAAANEGETKIAVTMDRAGRVLGRALHAFASLVRPQTIMLSGPLAGSRDYVTACRSAFLDLDSGHGLAPISVKTSELTAQAAARWLAIGTYLVELPVDIEPLKVKEAA